MVLTPDTRTSPDSTHTTRSDKADRADSVSPASTLVSAHDVRELILFGTNHPQTHVQMRSILLEGLDRLTRLARAEDVVSIGSDSSDEGSDREEDVPTSRPPFMPPTMTYTAAPSTRSLPRGPYQWPTASTNTGVRSFQSSTRAPLDLTATISQNTGRRGPPPPPGWLPTPVSVPNPRIWTTQTQNAPTTSRQGDSVNLPRYAGAGPGFIGIIRNGPPPATDNSSAFTQPMSSRSTGGPPQIHQMKSERGADALSAADRVGRVEDTVCSLKTQMGQLAAQSASTNDEIGTITSMLRTLLNFESRSTPDSSSAQQGQGGGETSLGSRDAHFSTPRS